MQSNGAKQCCNVFGRDEAVMALTADALREKLLLLCCCSAHMCYSPLHGGKFTSLRKLENAKREFVKELVRIFYLIYSGRCGVKVSLNIFSSRNENDTGSDKLWLRH